MLYQLINFAFGVILLLYILYLLDQFYFCCTTYIKIICASTFVNDSTVTFTEICLLALVWVPNSSMKNLGFLKETDSFAGK